MYRPGASVELPEDRAAELLAAGKIQHTGIEGKTGTILDGDITIGDGRAEESPVELADEPEGEKPLKAHTVDELRDVAKGLGVASDIADHLKKAELLEAIERLTHTSD
jgi:hypothetical protein